MICQLTPEAAAALEDSIKHWEANVAAETPDDVSLGLYACALCREFRPADGWEECFGCPVRQRTGRSCCEGSPYGAAEDTFNRWFTHQDDDNRDAFRITAQAELDFLISLRAPVESAP